MQQGESADLEGCSSGVKEAAADERLNNGICVSGIVFPLFSFSGHDVRIKHSIKWLRFWPNS